MALTSAPAAAELIHRYLSDHVVSRVWRREPGVWGAAAGSADERSIATRLGWLDVVSTMAPELDRLARVGTAAREERVQSVYLLGMGGSSLCAEVMRQVIGVADGHPDLLVLDTTDERTITDAAARMDPARTWFIVASKSGGTVEVSSMERFFFERISNRMGNAAGRQFIAITDPNTALQSLARSRQYREVFLNPADIGGRFSALSLFGLVPAALIGIPPRDLLGPAAAMAEGCRQEHPTNPGLQLGTFIGAASAAGRDKLTVLLPPSLAALGLWIEQLIAESTGKHGKGSLPVVDEPVGPPAVYGGDRAFVSVTTERDGPDARQVDALEADGHPVLRLTTRAQDLGSEFFRWEFATAIAGAAIGINPFDEPNVAEAKEKTKALLASFASSGSLPEPRPAASEPSVSAFSAAFTGASPADVIRAALASLRDGDYVAFLSYLPAAGETRTAVAAVRDDIRAKHHVATTFGVGPRYLHSTGQYHKGGPNKALAFVVTADDGTDTPIPESGYSFSVLKRAQALGDAETLEAHGRRVVRLHFADAERAGQTLRLLFAEAMR